MPCRNNQATEPTHQSPIKVLSRHSTQFLYLGSKSLLPFAIKEPNTPNANWESQVAVAPQHHPWQTLPSIAHNRGNTPETVNNIY